MVTINVTGDERVEWETEERRIDTGNGKYSPRTQGLNRVPDKLRVANDEQFDRFRERPGKAG